MAKKHHRDDLAQLIAMGEGPGTPEGRDLLDDLRIAREATSDAEADALLAKKHGNTEAVRKARGATAKLSDRDKREVSRTVDDMLSKRGTDKPN